MCLELGEEGSQDVWVWFGYASRAWLFAEAAPPAPRGGHSPARPTPSQGAKSARAARMLEKEQGRGFLEQVSFGKSSAFHNAGVKRAAWLQLCCHAGGSLRPLCHLLLSPLSPLALVAAQEFPFWTDMRIFRVFALSFLSDVCMCMGAWKMDSGEQNLEFSIPSNPAQIRLFPNLSRWLSFLTLLGAWGCKKRWYSSPY